MPETTYLQCELTRQIDGGLSRMVSWIPEKLAVVGKVLRLKGKDDAWTDGWKVENATHPAISESVLTKNSRDHLKTRMASDI